MTRASFTVFHIHHRTYDVVGERLPYRSVPSCFVFTYLLHLPDPQRPPHPLQEVGAMAQARPLAGVSLVEWLTQPQTQVMSPNSPTSSDTWIPSTRRSISSTATTFPVPRRRYHDSHQSRRFTEFRSVQQQASSKQSFITVRTPVSGSRVHVMCRVVLASRKLEQSLTESIATLLSVHSRKGKRDRDQDVVQTLRDRQNLPENP